MGLVERELVVTDEDALSNQGEEMLRVGLYVHPSIDSKNVVCSKQGFMRADRRLMDVIKL